MTQQGSPPDEKTSCSLSTNSHLVKVTYVMSAIMRCRWGGALKMEILFETTLRCEKCPELIRGPDVRAGFNHFNESVE